MNNTKRTVERLKTIIIFVLLTSMVLLGWRTKLFNDFFSTINIFGTASKTSKGTSKTEISRTTVREAARPLCVVITGADGGRCGIKYDTDARNAIYDRTCGIFGEALGSASNIAEISETEWREALSGSSIYYGYTIPIKLSILGTWLGAKVDQETMIRRIFITFNEEKNKLYYQDFESGIFFVADTASTAGKTQELDIYSANDARFAFETNIKAAANAPYLLIMPNSEHSCVTASSSGSAVDLLDTALTVFGHSNESYTKPFIDGNGTLNCIGTQFTMSVDSSGGMMYRRSEISPPTHALQPLGESDMIETARAIVSETINATSGGAEAFYESIEYISDDTCSVIFGYYIAGGRIILHDDKYAARITFKLGSVSDVELNFRKFATSADRMNLLPEKQALAAARGEFILCYSDSGTETIPPFWLNRSA